MNPNESNRTPRRNRGGKYAAKKQPAAPRRRNQKKRRPSPIVPAVLAVVLVGLLIWLWPSPEAPAAPDGSTPPSVTDRETRPREQVVSTATLGSSGDLLIHKQLINAAKQEEDYDFSPIFQYLSPYVTGLDYAVANLETTFGGPGCGTPYQGNPLFNCPDDFADDVKTAGFDMLLTANNHAGDTNAEGILRTLDQLESRGLESLGTFHGPEEPRYKIVDVNGIKLGMICYTYATNAENGRPSLNFRPFLTKSGIVNYFRETDLDAFYTEMETHLENMKAEGADLTIVYLHWGREYELTETAPQKAMAQKLCDLGVDAIIGGHPHVVEPMDLLTSTLDPDHKTVCLYSMGNLVSNQRREHMDLNTGHTEDGLLYTLTFEKYSDGRAYILDVDVLPVWVNMLGTLKVPTDYFILPLDKAKESSWQADFGLSDAAFQETQRSYDRTMDIVGPGLQECKDYLSQAKLDREQRYLEASLSPAA